MNIPKTLCPLCQTPVSESSVYCTACGAPIDSATEVAGELARRSEAQLAAANLLRMRAQWAEAESHCVEVMRADPNNVHAHSLLGDIYRDQGLSDQAAQWYQMALDLNPTSSADRAKLDRIEREQARKAIDHTAGSSGYDPIPGGTQKLMGLPPLLWLRGMTVAVVAFIVLVIIVVVGMRHSGHQAASVQAGTLPGSVSPILDPSGSPSMMPAPDASRPIEFGRTLPTANGGWTDQEISLINDLSHPGAIDNNTTVASVSLDQQQQRVLIVLLERPTGQSAAPILRDATARSALHAVQLAFTKNPSLQHAIVSVRLVPDSGHVQPLFDGEIDRTAAQGVSSTGSAEQALAAFKGVEWASTSSPTTPPSSQGHDTDHLEPSTPGPHSSPTPGSSTPPPNDPNPSGG